MINLDRILILGRLDISYSFRLSPLKPFLARINSAKRGFMQEMSLNLTAQFKYSNGD
jgi:hypothetical protein